MKLFSVAVMYDSCDSNEIMVVANNEQEAEKKVNEMDSEEPMFCLATEIDIVDGYRIKLERIVD